MTLLEHLDAMAEQIYDLADAYEDTQPLDPAQPWAWILFCRFSNTKQLGRERRLAALEQSK